jgi:hypothetical protein
MLLICQKEKNTQQVLGVSHVMWSELHSTVVERKYPLYGPCLMQLIEDTWASTFIDEMFVTGDLTSHEVIHLKKKDNLGTSDAPEVESEGGDEPDYGPSDDEPSWAKKLKKKMKKHFYFEAHGQYKAHVAQKKACSHDKSIMRHVGLEAISGSEDRITSEEEWISKNCKWTDSDDDQPAAAEEESNGHKEEEHDDDVIDME